MIKKGTWVRIHKVILAPDQRSSKLPDATKKVPLDMWTKGRLVDDARIGDFVKIITKTKRIEEGTLIEVNPTFKHNYGDFVEEILIIDDMLESLMDGENHES